MYRQRVGLAQALLHDPNVLILDEPTSGLDPNQIIEVRNLIKNISLEKTVLFSTHIMQEAQAICDRVVVIDHGKIVADDSVEKLAHDAQGSVLEIEFSQPVDPTVFSALVSIDAIEEVEANKILIRMEIGQDIRPEIMDLISKHGLPMIGMNLQSKSLEEIFSDLTYAKDV